MFWLFIVVLVFVHFFTFFIFWLQLPKFASKNLTYKYLKIYLIDDGTDIVVSLLKILFHTQYR